MSKLPKMSSAEGRPPKGYPVREIRDFIQHLLWEARIAHLEATAPGTENPELVAELVRYCRKYGGVLWPSRHIEQGDVSDEDLVRAVDVQRTREAAAAAAAVEALETALPFIERALDIHASRTVPIHHIKANVILGGKEEQP